MKVQKAMETIKQAMIDDTPQERGSYAHSWHCNIAMACYNAMADAAEETDEVFCHDNAMKISNDAASLFMRVCFDVETKG